MEGVGRGAGMNSILLDLEDGATCGGCEYVFYGSQPLASKMREVYYTAMEPVKAPNLSLLTKAHENKWVAFSLDYQKLLAVASSLIELMKKPETRKGIVMRVLPCRLAV